MASGFKSPQSRTGLIGDQYVYSASVGTLTTAKRPPRCRAGRGTHIHYSTGLTTVQSSAVQVTAVRAASSTSCWFYPHRGVKKRKNEKMMFEYWAFACLERDGICFAKKYPNTLEKMSVVVSQVEFVEERQLGWEPDVALGVWAGSYSSGLRCDVANYYFPIPFAIPRVLILNPSTSSALLSGSSP